MSTFFTRMILFAALVSASAWAHQMQQHTSQITLRDGQVEVVMHIDGHKWLSKLSDHHSWLLGDTEIVIDASLSSKLKAEKLKQILSKEVKLLVNNAKVPLQIDKISYYDSMLHLRIVMSARLSVSSQQMNKLAIKYPKSLESVYTSIAKPQYKLAAADKVIEFNLN